MALHQGWRSCPARGSFEWSPNVYHTWHPHGSHTPGTHCLRCPASSGHVIQSSNSCHFPHPFWEVWLCLDKIRASFIRVHKTVRPDIYGTNIQAFVMACTSVHTAICQDKCQIRMSKNYIKANVGALMRVVVRDLLWEYYTSFIKEEGSEEYTVFKSLYLAVFLSSPKIFSLSYFTSLEFHYNACSWWVQQPANIFKECNLRGMG